MSASLSTAVLEDDVDTLCLVPGVGKKTAARLLLELKARLDLPTLGGNGPAGGSVGSPRGEARAALAELGYDPEEIRGALEVVDEDGLTLRETAPGVTVDEVQAATGPTLRVAT